MLAVGQNKDKLQDLFKTTTWTKKEFTLIVMCCFPKKMLFGAQKAQNLT